MTIIRLFAIMISIAITFSTESSAQGSQLEVKILNNETPVIIHTLDEGQTIYGISKTYNLEINTLMDANPLLEPDNLKIGQDIIVPIQSSEICYQEDKCPEDQNVQLVYNVKHKDNLFRISRIYFNTDIEVIKGKNKLKGNSLSPGTQLNIGRIAYSDYLDSYLKPEHIDVVTQITPSEARIQDTHKKSNNSEIPSISEGGKNEGEEMIALDTNIELEPIESHEDKAEERLEKEFSDENIAKIERVVDENMITEGATAYWNKNQSSKKGFFILHKSLPTNSKIQITNPVTHQMVTAKVVGNIPDNIYAPEIELVVTSEVANAIGVLDKKFYAKISYPKDLSLNSFNE